MVPWTGAAPFRRTYDYPYEQAEKIMALNGLMGDSVLSRTWCKFADRQDHPEDAEEETKLTKLATGALFRAAAETTWSTVNVAVLFTTVILNPECQKRGQEEISRVIGFRKTARVRGYGCVALHYRYRS
ncbi:hypothetical protein BDN71DRAFT_1442562 [Pleurotus eryngii]|uniref:Uncharacterized protein n=1 Tax=Pleurotus eryngii TaxID=5323 RepID=A0A9P6DJA0_PLEER|nr:hypothetical protein BDN71DRAFT_1442562 [Pleurotus eryngii]